MSATGLTALVAAGVLAVAVAILIVVSMARVHRRFGGAVDEHGDPELAKAMAEVEASIEKGRRGL